MRIVVLNGSPKGALSVTMQHVRYLETVFPEHGFVPIHVAARVGDLVK